MTTPTVFTRECCSSVLAFGVTQKTTRVGILDFTGAMIFLHKLIRPLLLIMTLIVTLATSLSLQAQSLKELERLLLQHPELQAMTFSAASSRERSETAKALPDPMVSLGVNNFPIFDPSFSEFLPTNKAIGLEQRFPSRAARRARAAIGQAEANQIDEKRKQLFAAMRAELIASLHHKTRIGVQRSLAKKRDVKYDQLIDTAESAIQGGRPSVFRLAEIEAERAEVARNLVDLDAQQAQIDARLMYLLGLIPITVLPSTYAESLSVEQGTVEQGSGEQINFQASRVADATVEMRESGVDEAKAAWKPEWGAQLIYQQRESGRDFAGDDWVSMMVTFTVPFWANKKQAPGLRAAKASRAAAQASLEAVTRQATAQYASSKASHQAALQARQILQQKIDAISGEISAQRANYESGAGDYTPVLDGEIAILKLRSEIATEQARAEVALAQMNALLVTP